MPRLRCRCGVSPELGFFTPMTVGMLCLLWLIVATELIKLGQARYNVGMDLMRKVTQASEILWLIDNRDRLAEWQEISEKSLDEGTATVRAIHHAIAAIPFTILEAIPATRDTTRLVHGIHDVAANGVYAGISLANRALGKQLRQQLPGDAADIDAKSVSKQDPE